MVKEKRGMSAWKVLAIIFSVLLILGCLSLFGLGKLRDNNRIYFIPSGAMAPTLQPDDRIRSKKLPAKTPISRGDIVIFDTPANAPDPQVETMIKRVVAMPGETIETRRGVVYVNGQPLPEPYLPRGTTTTDLRRTLVPNGQYYMLGDNRSNSIDSRNYGAVSRDLITRRAVGIIYPVDRRMDLP